jgi:formate dehydrogenase major subunit
MAEAHPVGFQHVVDAKNRGAKIIHVDPRFTRTSALAHTYVPIRAGADIAFLGGIVNYILSNEKDFREYVLAYTNAATLVNEDFRDTEDLDGLFSGYDEELNTYHQGSWAYEGQGEQGHSHEEAHADRETAAGLQHESHGSPVSGDVPRDPTLQHPRCVYQVLKRHYARYTPEVVERVCGVSQDQFREVCEAWTANSGRERTTALVYSVGWTQHSVGVQYIRTGAIIQLLLGNMGRPGGGVMALRGHASIQGSTDIPTLFNLLPGYLPMPNYRTHETFRQWVDAIRHPGQKGFWADAEAFAVSLLKAYFGDAATADNDWGYGWLPRLTGDHGTYQQVLDMIDGKIKGYFLLGQNPAVGSAHGKAQRLGMANLDWLVVRDLYMIESATFWKDSPEIATGEIVPTECRTEVFFLPAASHAEKAGTFTQTQRMLQWREQAVEPPGDCRSELWFFYHLGRMIRARPGHPQPELGLRAARRARRRTERRGRAQGDQRLRHGHRRAGPRFPLAQGRRHHRLRLLDLLRGLQGRRQPGRPPQARLGAGLGGRRVGLGLAVGPAHALQPRLRRPGRSPLVGAEEVRVVGPGRRRGGRMDRPRRARLREDQAAVVPAAGGRHGRRGARRR